MSLLSDSTNFAATRFMWVLCAATALGGCVTVGRDYVEPDLTIPEQFDIEAATVESEVFRFMPPKSGPLQSQRANAEQADDTDDSPLDELAEEGWWSRFDDPTLTIIVEKVLSANLDLAVAVERLEQAGALRAAEVSARWPQVDTSGGGSRLELREDTPESLNGRALNRYELSLDVAWELDLWGRVKRLIEAADGDLQAAAEDVEATRIWLAGSASRSYIELRGLEARLRIAEKNEKVQEQTLELVEARYESGLVSQLDVSQARASLEQVRASVPGLRLGAELARDRLAVLTGSLPGELDEELQLAEGKEAAVPKLAQSIPVAVPAELIRRRPDVRAAERRLAAATARIGVARAELYPQLRLTGNIGFTAASTTDLLSSSSRALSIGPFFRWNLFDRRRLRALIGFRESVAEQHLLQYRLVVLKAIEELEGRLESIRAETQRSEALSRSLEASRNALTLSSIRYRQGLASFQTVLDAQRTLFAADDSLQVNRITQSISTVDLLQAFGNFGASNRLLDNLERSTGARW